MCCACNHKKKNLIINHEITGPLSSDSNVIKRDVSDTSVINTTTVDPNVIPIKAHYVDILAGRDGRDGLQGPAGVNGLKV